MVAARYPDWRWQQLLLANLAAALAHPVTTVLSALIALAPAYPSPVFPPAGVGLALVAVGGWRVLPGVALGPLLGYLAGSWPGVAAHGMTAVLAVATVMCGSALQAMAGGLAVRHWIQPAIDSGRDVMRFLLLAPVSCVLSAGFDVANLTGLGLIAPQHRTESFINWWAGDTIGVLLAAPLTWIVCGEPRALWRRRAGLVALPLIMAAAAVLATYEQAVRWEHEQGLSRFRLRAQQAGDLIQAEFNEHVRFVQTFARALGDLQVRLSQDKFLTIAGGYVDGRPEVQGINWAARVTLGERAGFEDWARRNIDPNYEVRELAPGGGLRRAPMRAVYFPILFTTPPANAVALGLDFLSSPERAEAARRALAEPAPVASAPLRLVADGTYGTALFKAVGATDQPAAGMVVLVVNARAMTRRAAAVSGMDHYALDLRDVTYGDDLPLISSGRPLRTDDFNMLVSFAGRYYALR
ncbi:MAG: CHASE domain-containing protein, partial [Ramlibacter sp.]